MSAKPKILFVVQSLIKGGAERLTLEVAAELTRRNLAEVMIAGFDGRNDYPGLSAGMNIKVCPVKFDLSLLKKNEIDLSELNGIINEFQPDIIHTHCYMQEAPPRENILPGVAYFTHIHDNMPVFSASFFPSVFSRKGISLFYERRRLIKRYRLTGNHFIAISHNTYDYFFRHLPVGLRNRLHLLPNGIKYARFRHDVRRSIDRNKPIRLINVGHAAPGKNQVFLIRVLHELNKRGLNVQLELVGDLSKAEQQIAGECLRYGMGDKVLRTGLVENVEEHLKQSDIYVHSSLSESFGLVILEAMAAGLPVVCLDAGGNRDLIEEGKNGFMLPQPDATLFAEKIISLIQNDSLYTGISEYAKKFVATYDIGNYADRLMELYCKAIAEKRTRKG